MLRHAEWQRVTDVSVGAIVRDKTIFFVGLLRKDSILLKEQLI
jgi:hypothetical protein